MAVCICRAASAAGDDETKKKRESVPKAFKRIKVELADVPGVLHELAADCTEDIPEDQRRLYATAKAAVMRFREQVSASGRFVAERIAWPCKHTSGMGCTSSAITYPWIALRHASMQPHYQMRTTD